MKPARGPRRTRQVSPRIGRHGVKAPVDRPSPQALSRCPNGESEAKETGSAPAQVTQSATPPRLKRLICSGNRLDGGNSSITGMDPMLVTFFGGERGSWSVERIIAVKGAPVQAARRVAILEGWGHHLPSKASWLLRGVTSHDRYVTAEERESLRVRSAPLGRPPSTEAALIPIKKSAAWWALPQDERRAIFEERSHHIAASLPYLPNIARRLHHGR